MYKSTSNFFKGLGIGAAMGVVTIAAMSCMYNNKSAKRKLGGAVKTASDIMENIACMLK